MRVQGGQNLYGFTVGILTLDTRFPRIVGDVGNAMTFDFPVRYHRVAGASPDRVVRQTGRDLLPAFVDGARFLEREGVQAIGTSCGFLARFQPEITAAVQIPVLTSSLLLVPLLHRLLPPGRAVGILTVEASSLTAEHFTGAGIGPDIPVVVAGLEGEKEFSRALLEDLPTLDVEAAREEHLRVSRRLVAEHPEVGALVLECTNMPPYRADIQRATGLPVVDVVTLIRMVHDALVHGLPPLAAL